MAKSTAPPATLCLLLKPDPYQTQPFDRITVHSPSQNENHFDVIFDSIFNLYRSYPFFRYNFSEPDKEVEYTDLKARDIPNLPLPVIDFADVKNFGPFTKPMYDGLKKLVAEFHTKSVIWELGYHFMIMNKITFLADFWQDVDGNVSFCVLSEGLKNVHSIVDSAMQDGLFVVDYILKHYPVQGSSLMYDGNKGLVYHAIHPNITYFYSEPK